MTKQRSTAKVAAGLALVLPLAATGQPGPMDNREVRTTIIPGTAPIIPPPMAPVRVLPGGDISLNFPGVDAAIVAKAVLGDTLHVPYFVDPAVHMDVTVVTPHPIRRADVLGFFEQALTSANLVLADRAGVMTVLPTMTARGEAPTVGPNDQGYGNEAIQLRFVNAEEMRKLLDPLVPNAVSVADPVHNTLIISGNSTQRAALRDLVAQFDVDWLKGMSFALFIPQRTDARLIAPELEKLLNAPGSPSAGLVRMIAMDQLNGILAITSQPQYLDDVRRFVEVLDREGESAERRVFVYRVQNGRAADLAKVLNSAFGNGGSSSGPTGAEAPELIDHTAPAAASLPPPQPQQTTVQSDVSPNAMLIGQGASTAFAPQTQRAFIAQSAALGPEGQQSRGAVSGANASGTTITADETNNAIVVYSTPRDYALIEDALRKLDLPPLEVMIDATISEVTLNHNLQYGIQWAFQAGRLGGVLTQATAATANPVTGAPINPGPQQNFPGLSFLYQGNGVSATLNALAAQTDVTVLSAPKLMVLNNHTASIEVGDQVPISTGSAVSTLTSGAPIVNSIEYRDTGIILKITPRVNSGGLVLLDIAQEVSDVLPQAGSQANSQDQSPTIEQRKISTSVAVQDGETVALGGLIKNEVTKGRSTIPLLGDIPIIGHLFGDTTGGLMRTELVVLLTPKVIRTPVDARAVTEELRARIHEAAPPPLPTAKAKKTRATR